MNLLLEQLRELTPAPDSAPSEPQKTLDSGVRRNDDSGGRNDPPTTPAQLHESNQTARLDAFYMQFEDECRGDESEIRKRLLTYLPRLQALPATQRPQRPCSTWVAAAASGSRYWASRASPPAASTCPPWRRPTASSANCKWNAPTPSTTCAASPTPATARVTAFHLIEHLPFDLLFQLVEQSQRVLVPGGLLLLETPNPENVRVGSHTFYHDPTHRNPITPTLISFLLRYLGLDRVEIERLHPYPEQDRVPGLDPLTEWVNGAFCGPPGFRRPRLPARMSTA